MARFNFTQDPEEPDLWAAELVPAGAGRPPIHVMIQTDGEEPGSGASKAVKSIIDKLDDHVLAASEFLLDHYSYEQCKKHGYEDDQLLAEETAEAMAGKAVARAVAVRRGRRGLRTMVHAALGPGPYLRRGVRGRRAGGLFGQ